MWLSLWQGPVDKRLLLWSELASHSGSLALPFFTSLSQKTFASFDLYDEVQKQIPGSDLALGSVRRDHRQASSKPPLTLPPHKTLCPEFGAHLTMHGSDVKHSRLICFSEHGNRGKLMAASKRSLSGPRSMQFETKWSENVIINVRDMLWERCH